MAVKLTVKRAATGQLFPRAEPVDDPERLSLDKRNQDINCRRSHEITENVELVTSRLIALIVKT